jgi:hypothetical protein
MKSQIIVPVIIVSIFILLLVFLSCQKHHVTIPAISDVAAALNDEKFRSIWGKLERIQSSAWDKWWGKDKELIKDFQENQKKFETTLLPVEMYQAEMTSQRKLTADDIDRLQEEKRRQNNEQLAKKFEVELSEKTFREMTPLGVIETTKKGVTEETEKEALPFLRNLQALEQDNFDKLFKRQQAQNPNIILSEANKQELTKEIRIESRRLALETIQKLFPDPVFIAKLNKFIKEQEDEVKQDLVWTKQVREDALTKHAVEIHFRDQFLQTTILQRYHSVVIPSGCYD